jgi:hypothetical protein
MLKSTMLCAIAFCLATPALAQYSYDRGYNNGYDDAELQNNMRRNDQIGRDWQRQMDDDRLNQQRSRDESYQRSQMRELQDENDMLRRLGR